MSLNTTVKRETLPPLFVDFRKFFVGENNSRFDALHLVQAKEQLQGLLKAQITPIESSQSLDSQLVFSCC
jgi:hypothetical protein